MANTKTIYRAVSPSDHKDYPNQKWLSIDGDSWLPVEFIGTWDDWHTDFNDMHECVAEWFAVKKTIKNGRTSMFQKMTFAKRYVIGKWGGGATIIEPITG